MTITEPETKTKRAMIESGRLDDSLIVAHNPNSLSAESFRTLRTSLIYSFVDSPPKVVVITSSGPREGKSTLCANLGIVLAQGGKRTLIMDCDFRSPRIQHLFGLDSIQGISDILAGENELHEVSHKVAEGLSLDILLPGALPPNPAELVGTVSLARFISLIRSQYDFVLIDSPPAGMFSDATVLAMHADGVLITLDAQKTRKADLRRTVRSMTSVGANVMGTVMNNAKYSPDAYFKDSPYTR